MDIYKPIFAKVVKPLWLKHKGEDHTKYRSQVKHFHDQRIDEIRSYQLHRLQKIVSAAYESVPYYRKEWDRLGLKPQDIRALEDLKKIPVLTKEKLRAYNDELVSNHTDMADMIVTRTGGTTAVPMKLLYDRKRLLYKTAEMDFFRQWWGWDFGDKVAYLWGAPQDFPDLNSLKYKIYNTLFGRNLFLFSSLLDDDIMADYVRQIGKFRPGILQAYTNPAYILSLYILRKRIKVFSPKAIILTAELIHDHQRETVEKAFQAPVYTFYGARETGYAGVECAAHNGYHVNCSSLIMEIVLNNVDVRPGELGSILFTDLLNTDMPLIRYQIEDMGMLSDEPCICGSTLPKMEFFAGRETDVFVTPDGKYVPSVTMANIVGVCNGIKALQIIQNRPDKINVKIVKGADFSQKDLEKLDHEMNLYFRGAAKVTKEYVDQIPKAASGKTRLCICNVPKHCELN